jgi:hypothetical protein
MADLAADEQAATFQLAHQFLLGQQLAATEVVGNLGGNAEQHFGFFPVEPDVVFVFDIGLNRGIRGKGLFGDAQLTDPAEGKRLELALLGGGQIPDAVFVDQPIGV